MSFECINFEARNDVNEFAHKWMAQTLKTLPLKSTVKTAIIKTESGFQFLVLMTVEGKAYSVDQFVSMDQCNGKERDWQKRVFQFLITELTDQLPQQHKSGLNFRTDVRDILGSNTFDPRDKGFLS